jgi:hypothetical protein
MKKSGSYNGFRMISGIGKTVPEIWQNVVACQGGIAPLQSVDMSEIRFQNGCEVKNYQPLNYFTTKELGMLG